MQEAKSDFSKLAAKIWESEEQRGGLEAQIKENERLLKESEETINELKSKLAAKEEEIKRIPEIEGMLEKQKQDSRLEKEQLMKRNQAIIDELKTELSKKTSELMEEKGKTLLQFIVSRYIRKE
ncbi:hypothetical protein HY792_00155 [Candidatus Desantisbacteria bacterium]|nr:hypothetical protein [Candidatus Desantisbacteria bacterium]